MSGNVEPRMPSEGTPEANMLERIAGEALDKTGGDTWNAGQPLGPSNAAIERAGLNEPPPKAGEESTSAPASTGEEPAEKSEMTLADAEAMVLKELGPLVGKYDSLAEAKKGIHNLIQALGNGQANGQATATPTPEPASEPDPLDDLISYGLPKEPFAKAMDQAVERRLGEREKAANEAFQARLEADRSIIERYPAYKERFDDLTSFLHTQPALEKQVSEAEKAGYHLLAREYAWLHFTASEAGKAESTLKQESEERKTVRQTQRSDARTMPRAQTTAPRLEPDQQVPNPTVTRDELKRLTALAREGYDTPLWRRTIGDFLPKDVFPDTV